MLGIPVGAILLIVLSVITAIVLRKTTFGWHIYAVGGNERAARMSGVKPDRVKIYVYMLSGACAALVGMINTAQLAAAHPASGDGWEMNAIAASVLGGKMCIRDSKVMSDEQYSQALAELEERKASL